jgi:tetratricopeptide (TPR) repeat protein
VQKSIVYNGIGYAYSELGQHSIAEQYFLRAVKHASYADESNMKLFLINLGNIYFKTDKFGLALENYERALTIDPSNNRLKVLKAQCLVRLNRSH